MANKYQLYKYIRFNSAVEAATWDDEKKKWKVDVKVTGGKDAEFSPSYSIESDFLVSAVGQLNQPRYPDIPGLDDFKGKIVHSARWDWSYDMQGKKIGVIGNGICPPSFPSELPTYLTDTNTLPRRHSSPNHPLHPPRLPLPNRLPTLPQLGHPPRRRPHPRLEARAVPLRAPSPLAAALSYDGFPRVVLRRGYGRAVRIRGYAALTL